MGILTVDLGESYCYIVSMGVAYLLFKGFLFYIGKSTPFYYFFTTFPLLLLVLLLTKESIINI